MFRLLGSGVWPERRKIFCFKRCLSQVVGVIFKEHQFFLRVHLEFGKTSDKYIIFFFVDYTMLCLFHPREEHVDPPF
jgi:hypothetical protein